MSKINSVINKAKQHVLSAMDEGVNDPGKMYFHLNYALGLLDALTEIYAEDNNGDSNRGN